jgi:hypothetical protein
MEIYIRNRIVSDLNKLGKLAEMKIFLALIIANSLIMYPDMKN